MSEANAQPELSLTPFEVRQVAARVLQTDRQFLIGLVVATVLHALFLTSFLSAEMRQLGDPGGSRDGISVDIVTDADLRRMATVADRAAGEPNSPAPPPAEAAATQPPAPPETAAPAEAVPPSPPPELRQQQAKPEPAQPPQPAQEAHEKAESPPPETTAALPEKTDTLPMPVDERLLKIPMQAALPDSLEPPKPPEPEKQAKPPRPDQAKPPQPKSPPKRTAALDLRMPPSFLAAPSGGGGAGIERPAGITRSGENDAFARGVIAALQRTMPQLRDTRGRVTVRIKLDKDGSLVRTEVLIRSDVAGLDQNVVFATRQTSFPFPPRGANDADLTFIITYIYR